jgi:FemAB-related protein (PEP-CTERM system-associated)
MIEAFAAPGSRGRKEISIVGFKGTAAAWDGVVASVPESTFCHLAGWREIMTDVLGHDTAFAVARDCEGECQGVLPLVRVRSSLLGDYLVSMPFLNAGGPIGSQAAVAALVEHAAALARRLGVDLLELRTRVLVPSSLWVTQRRITVLLELPPSADELWAAFPAKLRSQIRRPRKEGLEVRFGPEQLGAFYEVFARNMRDLGTPVLPRAFFERIAAVFPNLIVFGAVYNGEQPLAAAGGFVWRGEFEMTWASALREHRRLAANMLLYWSFIEQMIARGVRVFNFGRCTHGGGTHEFKRQWGGADVPLPWLQWSPRQLTAPPTPDRPVFRVASAVWRRLPLAVANRVGPVIARRIP